MTEYSDAERRFIEGIDPELSFALQFAVDPRLMYEISLPQFVFHLSIYGWECSALLRALDHLDQRGTPEFDALLEPSSIVDREVSMWNETPDRDELLYRYQRAVAIHDAEVAAASTSGWTL